MILFRPKLIAVEEGESGGWIYFTQIHLRVLQ